MNKKQKNKNFIVIISGVAGSGKGTMLDFLRKKPEMFFNTPSCTTRKIRQGEVDGRDYIFISEEEFKKGIDQGEFVEWEETRKGYNYGRRKVDLEKALSSGKIPIMEVDVLGMLKFKKMYEVVSIFVMPPNIEEAKKRLISRETDSKEAIDDRISRYELELGYKDKYDYILINDNLELAQEELMEIIEKEKHKRASHKNFINAFLIFAFLAAFLSSASFLGYQLYPGQPKAQPKVVIETNNSSENAEAKESQEIIEPKELPKEEIKNNIVKAPPKHEAAASQKIASTETVNNDGSKTVVVSTGDSSGASTSFSAIASYQVSAPADIVFLDETGSHSDLGPIIKNYLNSSLRWKNEIGSMKEIVLKDAGQTNWCGLYQASYDVSITGQVTNVVGNITLNANSNCFYDNASMFNDYMKLYLSHEYGHHYTLYHKWVSLDIPVDQRFPDKYYETRPLSKSTTATDYSLGWENCEAEIIAEDYSYFYSGYGLQAMHDRYGLAFPSAATKSWLDSLGSAEEASYDQNEAPLLSIVSPSENAIISGVFDFAVDASDDHGLQKVSFYVDDKLVKDIYNSPFGIKIDPSSSGIGSHQLKVVATDGSLETSKNISVTFQDTEKPEVSIITPITNPYDWLSGELSVKLGLKDNFSVDKTEVFLKNKRIGFWENDKSETLKNLEVTFAVSDLPKANNDLLIKVYDSSGNFAETTLVVNKAF